MKSKNTEAWAWVITHHAIIERAVHSLKKGTNLDIDDFRSATVERVVVRWSKYDPGKSAPITWVWWQARAVKKKMLGGQRYELVELEEPSHNGAAQIEAIVYLSQLKRMATPDEWSAVMARGEGLRGKELEERLGCNQFSARRRVARFIERSG
tara:strand:- start:1754 stop:2212 length:459 start_codon:yes stop_codon:yes gene_type:complete